MDNSSQYKGGFSELDVWKEARIFKAVSIII